jgi:hypothetical protein
MTHFENVTGAVGMTQHESAWNSSEWEGERSWNVFLEVAEWVMSLWTWHVLGFCKTFGLHKMQKTVELTT